MMTTGDIKDVLNKLGFFESKLTDVTEKFCIHPQLCLLPITIMVDFSNMSYWVKEYDPLSVVTMDMTADSESLCSFVAFLLYYFNKSEKSMGWMIDEELESLNEDPDKMDTLTNEDWAADMKDHSTTKSFFVMYSNKSTGMMMHSKWIEISTYLINNKRIPCISTFDVETQKYDMFMDLVSYGGLKRFVYVNYKSLNNLIEFINKWF